MCAWLLNLWTIYESECVHTHGNGQGPKSHATSSTCSRRLPIYVAQTATLYANWQINFELKGDFQKPFVIGQGCLL